MTDTAPAPASPQSTDPYDVALAAAIATPHAYNRTSVLDALEAAALKRAEATEVPEVGDPADAFPSPDHAMAYQFVAPAGLEVDDASATEARAALFEAGIPAEFVGQGFANLAQLHQSGALASDESYSQACAKCRSTLEGMHGEAASALIRDGIAYIEDLARRYPALDYAATAALADPFMLSRAADLKRHGTTRGRR